MFVKSKRQRNVPNIESLAQCPAAAEGTLGHGAEVMQMARKTVNFLDFSSAEL
jgi:hypothetical protein